MDMKRILQAIDGASTKPVEGSNDMKKFLQIVESTGPSNRLTQAESIAVQTYTAPEPRKTITSPVLNVNKDARPSMVGKYFKQIEEEFQESEQRYKDRSRQLAERVIKKISPQTKKKLKEETEGVDSVTLDIPLLIRLMEFAREDAQDDMTLHQVAERMIGMKEEGQALSMSDYKDIVGSIDEDAVDDFIAKGGKVVQGKYKPPRKSEKTDYGSKHIGGKRDAVAGKAGKTLGKAAKTNFKGDGKPVVNVEEAHGNSKIYDKCWTGFKKVPGKKRGEDGSCVKK